MRMCPFIPSSRVAAHLSSAQLDLISSPPVGRAGGPNERTLSWENYFTQKRRSLCSPRQAGAGGTSSSDSRFKEQRIRALEESNPRIVADFKQTSQPPSPSRAEREKSSTWEAGRLRFSCQLEPHTERIISFFQPFDGENSLWFGYIEHKKRKTVLK